MRLHATLLETRNYAVKSSGGNGRNHLFKRWFVTVVPEVEQNRGPFPALVRIHTPLAQRSKRVDAMSRSAPLNYQITLMKGNEAVLRRNAKYLFIPFSLGQSVFTVLGQKQFADNVSGRNAICISLLVRCILVHVQLTIDAVQGWSSFYRLRREHTGLTPHLRVPHSAAIKSEIGRIYGDLRPPGNGWSRAICMEMQERGIM